MRQVRNNGETRTNDITGRRAPAGLHQIAIAAALATGILFGAHAQAPSSPSGAAAVVYPGAPTGSSPAATSGANPQPGKPGMPLAAPTLPPLPGQGQVRPGGVAVDDTMPPNLADDVRELKKRMDDLVRASTASSGPISRPVTRSLTISQAAGEDPPVVRLASGVPTNVVFIDSTGQPWPIEFATSGDPNKFDVLMPAPGTANLQLRPRQAYGYGGLSVTLKGNPVPISLTLTMGQAEVDTRLDVKVARRGPNAAAPIIDTSGAAHATDVSLMNFLDGVPPRGSSELRTSSGLVRAWRWNDKMVVRSELPLISPAWTDSSTSPNGVTHAYILPFVPSILVSSDGRMVSVSIGQ